MNPYTGHRSSNQGIDGIICFWLRRNQKYSTLNRVTLPCMSGILGHLLHFVACCTLNSGTTSGKVRGTLGPPSYRDTNNTPAATLLGHFLAHPPEPNIAWSICDPPAPE